MRVRPAHRVSRSPNSAPHSLSPRPPNVPPPRLPPPPPSYQLVIEGGDDQVAFNTALGGAKMHWLKAHDSGEAAGKLEYEEARSVSVGEVWLGNPEMADEGGLHGLRVALLPHHKFPRRVRRGGGACDLSSCARHACAGLPSPPPATQCEDGAQTAAAVVLHCYTEKDGEAKEVLLKRMGAWVLKDDWKPRPVVEPGAPGLRGAWR